MNPILRDIAEQVAQACEMISVALVALGAAEAVGRLVLRWRDYGDLVLKRDIWRRFAAAILLSLEFALAAEIARTAIAPTWVDIGQLAAIAGLRTLLYLFLARDLGVERTLGAGHG